MEKLIEKLEFGNVRLLRKNLIVSSATAIVVSQLVKYSEDAIKFLAFTIPENNKPILNKLMWWIVLYFFVALVIRYFDEEFPKWYKKKLDAYNDYLHDYPNDFQEDDSYRIKLWNRYKGLHGLRKNLVFLLDILLPFVVGAIALYMSWSF